MNEVSKSNTVVATTRHSRTNDLTTSKALSKLSSKEWGNYKRTRQGALAAFVLYLYTWLLVCATIISNRPLSPCFILIFYYSSTCVFHKATMLPTCALMSYPLSYSIVLCHTSLISVVHAYTICAP